MAYGIPLVVAVSLRGDEVDKNPVQKPIGEATVQLIEAIGCEFFRVSSVEEAESALSCARTKAESERRPQFVLLPRREALC